MIQVQGLESRNKKLAAAKGSPLRLLRAIIWLRLHNPL